MAFYKKWMAVILSAAFMASNLAAPFSSVLAMGAQTSTSDSGYSAEAAGEFLYAEDVDSSECAEEERAAQPDLTEGEDAGADDEKVSQEMEASEDDAPEEDGSSLEDDASEGESMAPPTEGGKETAGEDSAAEETYEEAMDADAEEAGSGDRGNAEPADGASAGESSVPASLPAPAQKTTGSSGPLRIVDAAQDNDDLFAAYVNRELGLTGDLQADTGDVVYTPRSDRNYAATHLSGNALTVYGILLNLIEDVAAGERTDTLFTIGWEELGLEGRYWTAGELGVASIIENGEISSDAMCALDDLVGLSEDDCAQIVYALLADCPYDLYWFDKLKGWFPPSFWYDVIYENGEYRIRYSSDIEFGFIVADEYAGTSEDYSLTMNAGIGTSVQNAREKAQEIVAQYAGKTDYEKLDGYRKEICDLTDYNYDAADDDAAHYGNPWQLIWIFDQDPETKVVCEGYAKGFQYLCDLSTFNGIYRECIRVTGWLDGGGHMWNIVALRDGRNYLVDITNCDEGAIGEENGQPGRLLFLVGTGSASSSNVYAQGSLDQGYVFGQLDGLKYEYDEETRSTFDDDILTLAAGRVDASTTADGGSGGSGEDHTHIYVPVGEVPSDCLHKGHSAGHLCSICGKYDSDITIYPLGDHTPGKWTVTTKPTYTKAGVETTTCTVCGEKMTRSVAKLVRPTGISLGDDYILLRIGDSYTLDVVFSPSGASDSGLIWTSSDSSIASVDQNGTVKAKKYGDVTITATTSNGLTAACEVQTLFKDVYNSGKSYFTPVYWAVYWGITVCSINFRPDDPVTRGEFVAFLWRFADKPKSTAKINFKDVNSSTQFYDAIRWAVGCGIIKGYSDGYFRPENQVTRGETATMLWRADGKTDPGTTKSPFSDLKYSTADSYKAILWGAKYGIIKGSGGKFLKNDGCTRGQVVTFLYRYEKYLEKYYY